MALLRIAADLVLVARGEPSTAVRRWPPRLPAVLLVAVSAGRHQPNVSFLCRPSCSRSSARVGLVWVERAFAGIGRIVYLGLLGLRSSSPSASIHII